MSKLDFIRSQIPSRNFVDPAVPTAAEDTKPVMEVDSTDQLEEVRGLLRSACADPLVGHDMIELADIWRTHSINGAVAVAPDSDIVRRREAPPQFSEMPEGMYRISYGVASVSNAPPGQPVPVELPKGTATIRTITGRRVRPHAIAEPVVVPETTPFDWTVSQMLKGLPETTIPELKPKQSPTLAQVDESVKNIKNVIESSTTIPESVKQKLYADLDTVQLIIIGDHKC